MGVVAIGATHTPLHHRVAVGEFEIGADVEVTLEAGLRILAGVDNELGAAAGVDMKAAGAVAPFAACVLRILAGGHQAGVVGRLHKIADDVGMAVGTGVRTNEGGTRDVGWGHNRMLEGTARNEAACGEEANGRDAQNLGVGGGEDPTDPLAQSGDDSVLHEGLA